VTVATLAIGSLPSESVDDTAAREVRKAVFSGALF
jgi:hypothetical protein